MKLVEVKSEALYKKVENLYMRAFPKEERKPFWLIQTMQKNQVSDVLAIEREDGSFVGLAIAVYHGDMVLLDYFAMEDDVRGQGLGSEAFGLIKERYVGKRFFLEIEDSNAPCENRQQREKRKQFYLRHGMKPMPYIVDLVGVDMEVLTFECEIPFVEYYAFYDTVLQGRLSKKIKLVSRNEITL